MESILIDETKFKLDDCQKDRSDLVLNRLKSIMQNLKSHDVVNNDLYDSLVPKGAPPARLYGLPKIHKSDVPLRPILSMTGTPSHRVANWLAILLRPIKEDICHFCLDDTFEFINRIQPLSNSLNDGTRLASLDAVSLFTSVPVKRCIDIIVGNIQTKNIDLCLNIESLVQLLTLCVCDVQFLLDKKYYVQIDGVAMGSPLGPIFADIFMGHIEQLCHCNILSNTLFYGRYVDDIFLLTKTDDGCENLLQKFNSVQKYVKFTSQQESVDASLPFLDVKISRNTDSLSFSWYHKPTFSGQMLNFHSFCPLVWKQSLLRGFRNRISKICSPDRLHIAIDELEQIFIANGYPTEFINSNFTNYVPKTTSQKHHNVPQRPVYIRLPYLGEQRTRYLSNNITRITSKVFPTVRVIIIPSVTQSIYVKTKDKLPISLTPHVVYRFLCDCQSEYVGRTEKQLGQRIKEHCPGWVLRGNRTRPRSTKEPPSHITRHLMACNVFSMPHEPHFTIIHKTRSNFLNRVLEALEIKKCRPRICVQKEHLYTLKIPWE